MSKENQMNTQTGSELEELLCSDCGEKVSPADIKCPKCGAEFENDISDLDEEVTKGRKLAISVIAVSVAMLLVSGIIRMVNFDAGTLLTYFIRQGLTVLLLTLFYQGINGARIIMLVLFCIGGVISLVNGILLTNTTGLRILLILFGMIYVGISVVLASAKPIKTFQEYQREYNKRR